MSCSSGSGCSCSSTSSAASRMFKGDDRTFRLTVKDQTCQIVDLTGSSLIFTVKAFATDPTPAIQKSSMVAGEIDIIDPVNGVAEINILPSDTANLETGQYVFDIQLTTAASKIHTLLTGVLEICQDITN